MWIKMRGKNKNKKNPKSFFSGLRSSFFGKICSKGIDNDQELDLIDSDDEYRNKPLFIAIANYKKSKFNDIDLTINDKVVILSHRYVI